MGSYQPIVRIAIVGAGPSGLAAAKYLLAEKAFAKVDIFEQRSRVGGIWNLTGNERTKKIPLPQTNPRYGDFQFDDDSNLTPNFEEKPNSDSLELESPLYDYLETNIPKELMGFSDKKFGDDLPLFVGHELMLQYLDEYADDIRHLIQLDTQVRDVQPHSSSTEFGHRWNVRVRNLANGRYESSIYDAVVVANGHYTIPFVPNVRGLKAWSREYHGSVIHSKAYRLPEDYKGQKVLIVGNAVSGLDISSQIAPYCKKLLLSSRSTVVPGSPQPSSGPENVPGLSEFLPSIQMRRAVKFVDGRVEEDIDAVIFATGYFYNFPFLAGLNPPLVTDGLRTARLYKHVFYIDNPTLVFPVLNLRVIPLPLAENQAAVISRVWSGRLSLPPKLEMERWEHEKIKEQGPGKDFHLLKFPQDAEAMNEFYQWAASAKKALRLENNGVGKLGTFWDDRLLWMRSKFSDIKAAYAAKGRDRFQIRTVEELGFDFEKWKMQERQSTI